VANQTTSYTMEAPLIGTTNRLTIINKWQTGYSHTLWMSLYYNTNNKINISHTLWMSLYYNTNTKINIYHTLWMSLYYNTNTKLNISHTRISHSSSFMYFNIIILTQNNKNISNILYEASVINRLKVIVNTKKCHGWRLSHI